MKQRTVLLPLCLVVSVLVLVVGLAQAANWPRFRGPNGEGVAADKDIPIKFDEKSGILWKLELPGAGNSSPIVWNDRLFVQSATVQERMLLCIALPEGKILWSRTVPGNKVKVHDMNTLASASPATDGEIVVAAFWDGANHFLKAYDFAGNGKWERKLGPFKSEHGHGLSPIIHAGKVFFANDQDKSAVLLAFDAKTGQTLWEVKRTPFRANYNAPFLLEKPNNKTELICVNAMEASSYDPDNGAQNWSWPWLTNVKPLRTIGSPVLGNGMLVAFSGDGGGPRHTVGIKLDGSGPSTKAALVWENKESTQPYVPCPLIFGEHVYFVSDKQGAAGCMEVKTGKKVWFERLPGAGVVTASPILIDGKIYVCTENGDVYVFAASPKFQLLAHNSLGSGETIRATPAVANGRLYIRGENQLFCIGNVRTK